MHPNQITDPWFSLLLLQIGGGRCFGRKPHRFSKTHLSPLRRVLNLLGRYEAHMEVPVNLSNFEFFVLLALQIAAQMLLIQTRFP